MPESLATLEQQRTAIVSEILPRGDFRRGSITAISGRCGKPHCHCHQPGRPAHGPHYRLTKKVNGKTVSETFSSPAERRQAQREAAAFHHFGKLSRQLLEVNEKICPLRPTASANAKARRPAPARSNSAASSRQPTRRTTANAMRSG